MARKFAAIGLLLCGLVACTSDRDRRWKEKEARIRAQQEALAAARNVGRIRKPKLEVTPEQFAQIMAQPFGDADIALADPSGQVYRPLDRSWERDIRFDASNAAYDERRALLFGVSRSGRDLVALNLQTGALRRLASGVFKAVPRKVNPKKIARAEKQRIDDPVFERVGDLLVVAQNVSSLHELSVNVVGFRANGRVAWRKKVPNPWPDVFALWHEGSLVFLGDSSAGPLFTFDARTGRQGKIEYPKDETYVFGGSDGKRVVFYHLRRNNEVYLVAHGADGGVLWRRGLPECYSGTHKAYFAPFVNGSVLPCKVKTSVKEHVDRVMKISLVDGKTIWEVDALRRPADPLTDPQRPDLVSLRQGAGGVTYYRNRFGFARIESDGRLAWSYPLQDKEIYILVGNEAFRSDNVMAGDKAYEKVVSLDPATGKPRWEYVEDDGLPARGYVRDDVFVMWAESEIRVLSLSTGKLLFKNKMPQRIEAVTVQSGILYVDTLGVRRAYRLADGQLLLHDKSEDETVVNNWVPVGAYRGLLLYHDDDRRISRVEPVAGDQRVPVPKERVRRARLWTHPKVEIDGVRWVDDRLLEVTSPDDNRAWRVSLVDGKVTPAGPRREGARVARGGVAFLGDPTKVTERHALRLETGGKTRVLSARPVGEFAWSQSGWQIAFAERRDATANPRTGFKAFDLAVRVHDVRRDKTRDVLVLRGVDEQARLASASFGPGDRVLTMVLDGLWSHHAVVTLPVGSTTVGQIKVDDVEVAIRIPGNRAPTNRLGVDAGDTYGDVAWSPDGSHLATLKGRRLQILSASGRERLARPEAAVSTMVWSPRGATLYYVKDGNLWRYKGGRTEPITFFLAKLEPRVEEEAKMGILARFGLLTFSPDGKRLAFGLRTADDAPMRVAVLDVGE